MRKITELARINAKNPEFKAYLRLADFLCNENEESLSAWIRYTKQNNVKNVYDKQLFMKRLLDGGAPLLAKIKPVIYKTTGEIFCNANCLAALVFLKITDSCYDEV